MGAVLELGSVGLRFLCTGAGRIDDGVGALCSILVEDQGKVIIWATSASNILLEYKGQTSQGVPFSFSVALWVGARGSRSTSSTDALFPSHTSRM